MGLSKEHKQKISAALKARAERRRAVDAAAEASKITTLSSQGKRGRPGHNAIVRSAQRLERQAQAWRMLVAGEGMGTTSFADIGKALGVSGQVARDYCLQVANDLNRQMLNDAATLRAVQASQLAAIKKAHWKDRGKRANADVILRAMDREAKLLALDVEPAEGVVTMTQVRNMLRALAMLFMELVPEVEKRKQFALGIRRQLPSAARTHVETADQVPAAVIDDDAQVLDLGAE